MTLRNFTQLTSGQTLMTLTTSFTAGSGFTFRRFESWRGQENSETFMSNQSWFSTEEAATGAMNQFANELRLNGWN